MTSFSAQDPFEAFRDDKSASGSDMTTDLVVRDPSCGVLVHHEGTEQALYQHVRNELESSSSEAVASPTTKNKRERVLEIVDKFCMSRHWMMHVGNVKGRLVDDFLSERIIKSKSSTGSINNKPFIIVELGTYCGYSLIRMANTMYKEMGGETKPSLFHIFTVDVDAKNVEVAKEMARLAGLDLQACATFLILNGDSESIKEELSTMLLTNMMQKFPGRSPIIDFLFIDHAKEAYLRDLLQLEKCGLIRTGTAVCADNVFFFQLDGYRDHMQELAQKGIVETCLQMSSLEYVNDVTQQNEAPEKDLRDGLELTVYLKDPPSNT